MCLPLFGGCVKVFPDNWENEKGGSNRSQAATGQNLAELGNAIVSLVFGLGSPALRRGWGNWPPPRSMTPHFTGSV